MLFIEGALDWDTDGPFKDYPAILVYHPSESNANTFATLGFTGFIGSITGISQSRVSISEIGVYFSDCMICLCLHVCIFLHLVDDC